MPFLQDDSTARVWVNWGARWRDVIIVDPDNHVVETYNLSDHDLGDPANFARLKSLLVAAASSD